MQPQHQPFEQGGRPDFAPPTAASGWRQGAGPVPPHPGHHQHPHPGHTVPAPPGHGVPYQGGPAPMLTAPEQWNPAVPGIGMAEPGLRFAARLIDTLFFFMLWFLMMLVGTGVSVAVGGGEIEGTASNVFTVFYIFNFFLLPLLLEWAQVALWGRSLGKLILNLWVVRADGGGRITAGRALVRALLYAPGHTNLVNWLLPWSLTNVLWSLRDKTFRQCLHDKAAGTVVVQIRR